MALLARARVKDPEAGFVPDAVSRARAAARRHPRTRDQGRHQRRRPEPGRVRAGPARGGGAAGVPLRIAAIQGDDLICQLDQLHAAGAADMFTGEPLPEKPMTINAYLGARPIANALAAGADLVVTGRSVDSAVVLGPLLHEFGWSDGDYDLLSAGTLAGHIVECGPQCTGGNFTDWDTRSGLGRHRASRSPSAMRTAARSSPSRRARVGSSAGHGQRADPLRDRGPRRVRDAGRGLRLASGQARAGRPGSGQGVGSAGRPATGDLQGRPRRTPTATG